MLGPLHTDPDRRPSRTSPVSALPVGAVFASLGDAITEHRAAEAASHAARSRRDHAGAQAAYLRIRAVIDHLRHSGRTDLLFPLAMEWATHDGGHSTRHIRWRGEVDRIASSSPAALPPASSADVPGR